MTREEFVALKEESESRSVISQLGLCCELKGTDIIKRFISKKTTTKVLSDIEIEQVMDSWETRYYVPRELVETQKVDKIELEREEEEGERDIEYKRRKCEMIEQYVRTIHS